MLVYCITISRMFWLEVPRPSQYIKNFLIITRALCLSALYKVLFVECWRYEVELGLITLKSIIKNTWPCLWKHSLDYPSIWILVSFSDNKLFYEGTLVPNAESYFKLPMKIVYDRAEKQKVRTYNDRIVNVEHGTSVPLIFSTSGGFGGMGGQTSGVTTAPATPAMQRGGTLGGRHITKLTVF